MLIGDVDVQKIKEIFEQGEQKKKDFCKEIDTEVVLEAGRIIIDKIINDGKTFLSKTTNQKTHKTCKKCGETKSTTEFNKSRSNKDKLQSECRECHKKYMKEYRRKKNEQKTFNRAPPNTALFLNWIEKKEVFNLDDFINEYSYINKEKAEKIAFYQILKHKIAQIGKNKFKVILPKEGV